MLSLIRRFFIGHINRTMHVIVLLAFLPCLLVILYFGYRQNIEDRQEMQARMQEVEAAISMRHLGAIENTRSMLATLSLIQSVQDGDTQRVLSIFARLLSEPGALSNLMLTDRNGVVIASARGIMEGRNLSNLPTIAAAIDSGQFTLSNYLRDEATNEPGIYCVFPVVDYRGLRGLLVGTVDLKALTPDPRSLSFLPNAALVVADHRGTVVSSVPEELKYIPRGPILPHVQKIIAESSADQGVASAIDENGDKRLFTYTKLRTAESERWWLTYIISVREKDAYAHADSTMHNNILFLVAALMTGFIVPLWEG